MKFLKKFNENNKWYDIDNKLYLLRSYIHILDNNDNINIDLYKKYFIILHNFLIIERMFYDDVVINNKEINNNLKLEKLNTVEQVINKFNELYDVYNIIRNNIETFDNIDSIGNYLNKNKKIYTELI